MAILLLGTEVLRLDGNLFQMTIDILATIDAAIAKLQQARALLAGAPDVIPTSTGKRGRPKGSSNKPAEAVAPVKAKRTMSPEGRARIAEAQKKRHAVKKKAAKKAAKEAAQAEQAAE